MAGEDPEYIRWVKMSRCCMCKRACGSQAHHKTGAGMGMRSHDHEAIPLCALCHSNLHSRSGDFSSWSKEELAAWQEWQVARMRRVHGQGLGLAY